MELLVIVTATYLLAGCFGAIVAYLVTKGTQGRDMEERGPLRKFLVWTLVWPIVLYLIIDDAIAERRKRLEESACKNRQEALLGVSAYGDRVRAIEACRKVELLDAIIGNTDYSLDEWRIAFQRKAVIDTSNRAIDQPSEEVVSFLVKYLGHYSMGILSNDERVLANRLISDGYFMAIPPPVNGSYDMISTDKAYAVVSRWKRR